jgi:hypothetical protein
MLQVINCEMMLKWNWAMAAGFSMSMSPSMLCQLILINTWSAKPVEKPRFAHECTYKMYWTTKGPAYRFCCSQCCQSAVSTNRVWGVALFVRIWPF